MKVPFNKSNARILDYFKLFATSDFHLMISDQKNLYVEQYQLNSDDKSSSSWTPTTATETGHFLALHFLTEIVQKSQIGQYWSTDPLIRQYWSTDPLLRSTGVQVPFFRLQFSIKLLPEAGSKRFYSF